MAMAAEKFSGERWTSRQYWWLCKANQPLPRSAHHRPQVVAIRRPAGRLRAGPNPALAIRPLPASCRRVRPRRATSSGNSRSERLNAGCPAALPLRPDQAEGDAVVFLAIDRRGTRVRHLKAPSTSSGPSEPSPGLTLRAARCALPPRASGHYSPRWRGSRAEQSDRVGLR
jgi:hypothetical protein